MPNDIVKTSDIENVDWSTGTASAHYTNVVRYGSSSSQASQSSGDICRICHCESDPQNPLLTPCYCSGSLKYVHQTCLQQWLTASETNSCELCKFPFIMHTKIKPFNEWRSLDMSGVERRRLCCAVLFHCAAALCVIWSLCVLIERAAEEVKRGLIGWPFWTKLAVVTVGLTGGIVFMYIQCRQYLHLCHRWRARNRILLIQNAPEKIHPLSQPSPILHSRNIARNNSSTGCGIPPGDCGLIGSGTAGMTTNGYNYNLYGGNTCQTTGDGVDGPNNFVQITIMNQSVDGGTTDKNNYSHVPLHGQIVANIENNSSQNYDRDWNHDEGNQTSTFRPCAPQGSDNTNNQSCSNSMNGSKQDLSNTMPNLNSNILNNKSSNSTKSNRTNDLDLFKTTTPTTAQSLSSTVTTPVSHPLAAENAGSAIKYPSSSVFLENRDILNDAGFPKINYRHSSALTSPDITDNLDKFLGKDCRRYSDTKLLQTETVDILNPIFNVALNGTSSNPDEFRFRQHQKMKSGRNVVGGSVLGGGEQSLMQNILGAPQITDIIFESATQLDPLELNIQEMLDMDLNQHMNYSRRKMRRSLNHVEAASKILEDNESYSSDHHQHQEHDENHKLQQHVVAAQKTQDQQQQQIDKSRLFFKSLPNLSSSCESLIKK